jgi:hypothetical protein
MKDIILNTKNYVPILRLKQGEMNALSKIDDSVKKKIVPFLEVCDVDKNWNTGKPKKTISDHIQNRVELVQKCWGENDYFYFHLPAEYFYEEGRSNIDRGSLDILKTQKVIPVISLTDPEEHWEWAKQVYKKLEKPHFAILAQFSPEDDSTFEPTKEDYIKVFDFFDAKPKDADLIIDLQNIERTTVSTQYLATRLMISETPFLNDWNNLIVTSSSFPAHLGSIDKNSTKKMERIEWLTWLKLYDNKKRVKRTPIFGDYSISNPEIYDDIDPRIMKPSAAIRYTLENDWLILRGQSLKLYKYDQFHKLAEALSSSKYFYGKDYSSGDEFIYLCGNDENSNTGNLTTWREVGNSHHITLVVEQLANLP